MPPLVIAVVAAAASYGATAAAAAVLTGVISAAAVSVAAAVIGAVVGGVVAMGLGMLTQTKAKTATVESQASDQRQLVRSSVAARRVIYGVSKVSGPILYAASSGPDQQNLHLVVALAGHEVQAVDSIWIEDTGIPVSSLVGGTVTGGKYANVAGFGIHLGNQTEADGSLVAETPDGWDANHRLLGICYLHARLVYNREAYQGIPNISAIVVGRNKIYDPRSNTYGYTTNWALCVLDYLMSDFGLACSPDEIDMASFIAAANLSDEQVPLTADGTVTQARYTCNGSFTLDESPIDVMEKLLAAGAGALVYVAGQYRLHGGAYVTPSASLTASDFAGSVELQTMPPRAELFNGVRGTFIDPARFFQASEYPLIQDPAALAADGEEVWREVDFAFVDDPTRAQRLARQTLYRMRAPLTLKAPVRYSSIQFSIWQTVTVTLPDFGWTNKPFRIASFTFNPSDGTVSLTLTEEQVASYAWLYDAAYAVPDSPNTTLADPLSIPAPEWVSAIVSTAIQADGTIAPALDVSWAAAANPFVSAHEVQWQVPGGEWLSRDVAMPVLFAVLEPVISGQVYNVRVRGVAGLARGQWSALATPTAGADVTPPSVPGSLTTAGVLRGVSISWALPPERDLAAIEVYEGATTSTGSRVLIGETRASVYLRTGLPADTTRQYWVRARDRSGNVSAFAGPVAGTSSYLLADDIQDGILNTAKFASTIAPIQLIPNLSGTAPEGTVAVNTTDHKLYTFTGGAWRLTVQGLGPGGTLTDEQINDLDGAKLLDNTILAAKIAAGQITTSKLAVGSANQIWNSCLTRGTDGWVGDATSGGSAWILRSSYQTSNGAEAFAIAGAGSGYLRRPNLTLAVGQSIFADWRPSAPLLGVACVEGERWQARALLGTHRCEGQIELIWINGLNVEISRISSTKTSTLTGGVTDVTWAPHTLLGTAPAGAAFAMLRMSMVGNGGTDPFLFFSKTLLGKAPPNATEVGDWAAGGVTEISGGQIRTHTITAEQVNTGALFADAGTFNSLRAGVASFGGLRASEIAVGELRAYHMAAEEIISDSIQVRNLVVGTEKITAEAVSTVASASVYHGGGGGSGVYILANAFGFTLPGVRSGQISVTWTQAYLAVPLTTQIRVDVDGTTVREFATNATTNYNCITVPVSLSAGAHNVQVYWYGQTGNALLYEVDAVVFVRAR